MLKHLVITLFLMGFALPALADDTSRANELLVEAVQLLQSAEGTADAMERFRLSEEALGNLNELARSVADFHHRYTKSTVVTKLFLCAFHHRRWQRRRTCRKIKYLAHGWGDLIRPAWDDYCSAGVLDSVSMMRSSPTNFSFSRKEMSRTPCVFRPTTEISSTDVRTSVP